jgi:hypothetical protein
MVKLQQENSLIKNTAYHSEPIFGIVAAVSTNTRRVIELIEADMLLDSYRKGEDFESSVLQEETL